MDKFSNYFSTQAKTLLLNLIELAWQEDGEDLSAQIFPDQHESQAHLIAKEEGLISGLPLIPLIKEKFKLNFKINLHLQEGEKVFPQQKIASFIGKTSHLLRAERLILNFLSHLSGIATLTHKYVQKAQLYGVTILDTRKTLPGLRYLEKYAVTIGGGQNHRLNLSEMIMLKDNHLAAYPNIKEAVSYLRNKLTPCPPIEVECSNLKQVKEAVEANVERIMLDNMSLEEARKCLSLIPKTIETEISGNIDLNNIENYAALKPTYISVGKLTHSAKALDLSLKFVGEKTNAS